MSAAIELVVPVHNDERVLAQSIRRLHDHLSADFPFGWQIVIADNARPTTHGASHPRRPTTWRASSSCAWSRRGAGALRALLPLVAPLLPGHSDVARGTRLARVVEAGPRERQ